MNQPWIYMYSPSRSPLPPPSLPDPSVKPKVSHPLDINRNVILENKKKKENSYVSICICVFILNRVSIFNLKEKDYFQHEHSFKHWPSTYKSTE